MNSSPDIVYLTGEFLPAEQAFVPALDRGFIFGDGVYEVIPCYGGQLLRLEEHLQRLAQSLAAVRITNPLSDKQWSEVLQQLVLRNGRGDQSVYLQVTRGVAQRDHRFPGETQPTVFAMSNPLKPVAAADYAAGINAITVEDIRWQHCHIKAISLLPNVLLRQQAVDAGATEAILIRHGEATEGAASSLFIVKDGTLCTPPKDHKVLPGITRDLILELADQHDIPFQERPISEVELRGADEVWLTSSTKEIMPVTRLDDAPVGDGHPGPLWERMFTLYQAYKRALGATAQSGS